MAQLTGCTFTVSGIVHASLENVWQAMACFTRIGDVYTQRVHGKQLTSGLLPGGPQEYQIGCIRYVTIGEHSYCERLDGIDAVDHYIRYSLISHPDATNPFVASLLNFVCCARMYEVTVCGPNGTTFMTYEVQFETEPTAVADMTAQISAWVGGIFEGLNQLLGPPPPVSPPKPLGGGPIGSFVPGAASAFLGHKPGFAPGPPSFGSGPPRDPHLYSSTPSDLSAASPSPSQWPSTASRLAAQGAAGPYTSQGSLGS